MFTPLFKCFLFEKKKLINGFGRGFFMSPLHHFIICSILVIIFFPIFGFKTVMIFVGGFLIDIDHYFWYVVKKKNLSLITCHYYYQEVMETLEYKEVENVLFIFHTIEFLLFIVLLSFFTSYALLFLFGYLPHVIPDVIFEMKMWKKKVVSYSIIQFLAQRWSHVH